MYLTLGLDPASFTSTAIFCYIDCKKMTGTNIQTIPNGTCIRFNYGMKIAGFSMVMKQISIVSPMNVHVN